MHVLIEREEKCLKVALESRKLLSLRWAGSEFQFGGPP